MGSEKSLSKYKRIRNIFLIVKVYICAMNWLILIIAGLFETAFAFCLGKAQETTGKENLHWWSRICSLPFSF